MKNLKLKVLVVTLAVCLLAIGSLGTLAWFNASDEVTNQFLIADSEDDADKIFSVDVWEKADPSSNEKLDSIVYPDILPGDDLYKEVNIENTGYYAQYIRATVTVSDANVWQAIYGEEYVALDLIATDLNEDFAVWSIVCDEPNNTLTYILYYANTLAADEVVNLFTNVAIPEELTREQAAEMAGDFTINVVAEAVQTENVGSNAAEAFEFVGMGVEAGNYCIVKDTTVESFNGNWIRNNTMYENVTINSTQAGLQTAYVDVVLDDVVINAGSSADYSNILYGGNVVYNDVEINSAGGGVAALDGANVEFNGGSLVINSGSTSQRYHFYVVGDSTVVVNGGTFTIAAGQNLNRAYAYVASGSTLVINGGNFGTPTTKYPAGLIADGEIIITGGTFGFDPTAWVADGYVANYDDAAKTWTVVAE